MLKLTVYHDGQFWVGVVEVIEDGKLKAGRYVFGAEPKDPEILDFVNRFILRVTERLSQGISANAATKARISPKRLARQVSQEMQKTGVSTRAEDAIKLEYESRKRQRTVLTRQQRDEMKQHKRELARQKAKAKHRGK